MKKSIIKSRGFTLLELLLVVGIAAVLIVAGITTYSLVNKSNQINESVRLTNLILEQVRRLNSGQPLYSATANAIETGLINTGNVPAKFISGTNIITPAYATVAAAVTILGDATGQFTLTMSATGRNIPEIIAGFDPRRSDTITSITACSVTVTDASAATVLMDPATLAAANAACRSDTAATYTIVSR